MIALVRGTLTAKEGDVVTIMTPAGVGYEVAVPTGVLGRLPATGADIQLHTVLAVREDDWSLFGFDQRVDRSLFQRLVAAQGVGPRLALGMISALGGERVIRAIRDGDLAALCTVSGVGKKKAERLVLELKDRMGDFAAETPADAPGPIAAQAVAALVGLGYGQPVAEAAVRQVMAANGDADAAAIIRLSLQHVAKA